MTQKTYDQIRGWLPYGSSDDSVILQVSLTSQSELEAVSATSSAGIIADPTFDANLGMKCTGSSAGWLITELTGYEALDNEGQISMEVESSYLTTSLASAPSTGDDTVANNANDPTILGIRDAASNFGSVFGVNNVAQEVAKAAFTNFDGGLDSSRDLQFDAARNSTTPSNAPIYFHSEGKPQYSTINVGWAGNNHWLSVNGKMIMMESFTRHTGAFNRLYIGNLIGGVGYRMGDWFVRNLQISNRRPSFPVHRLLRRVITWSDSLFESVDTYSATTNDAAMDNTVNAQIRERLGERGVYCGWLDSDINDGYTVYTGVNNFSDVLSTITDAKPDIVVCQFGTNDVGAGASFSATSFTDTATDGYKALIDSLIAGGVQKIIACTVPTRNNASGNTQAITDAITAANSAIADLPSYNSNVHVADVFAAMGGHSAAANNFQSDGIHMNGVGMYAHGQAVADALFEII